MDELYMGTEEPQTELETEPGELRDEPVGQTETVGDAASAEDDMDPESAAAGSHQSGTQRRRKRRVRPAPVVSIDDRLGVETDADKARDAMLDLVESLKTRRILSGTVQGIERPGDGTNSVAVIYHGDFKVLIPAEEMVEKPCVLLQPAGDVPGVRSDDCAGLNGKLPTAERPQLRRQPLRTLGEQPHEWLGVCGLRAHDAARHRLV